MSTVVRKSSYHTFLVLLGLLYGLFGPFFTLFNTKTFLISKRVALT